AGRGGAGHALWQSVDPGGDHGPARARLRPYPGRAAVPAVRGQHHGHGGRRRDAPRRAPARPAGAAFHQALPPRTGLRPGPGRPRKLVMSFHGLPRYSIELGDPYYRDCLDTARLLRERLGLREDEVEMTFQSRFGSARWLEPYTEPTLAELARQGVTEVDVVC